MRLFLTVLCATILFFPQYFAMKFRENSLTDNEERASADNIATSVPSNKIYPKIVLGICTWLNST